jgi:hypothetical protein
MKFGEKNVGHFDKAVRIVAGLLFVAAFVLDIVRDPFDYPILLIGVLLLITGLYGTCALYSLLGINTAEPAPKKKK